MIDLDSVCSCTIESAVPRAKVIFFAKLKIPATEWWNDKKFGIKDFFALGTALSIVQLHSTQAI